MFHILSVSSYISVCQWDDYNQVSTVQDNQHLWSHALHVLRSAISLISTGTLQVDEKFLDTGKCRELWDLERYWERSLSKFPEFPSIVSWVSSSSRPSFPAHFYVVSCNMCVLRKCVNLVHSPRYAQLDRNMEKKCRRPIASRDILEFIIHYTNFMYWLWEVTLDRTTLGKQFVMSLVRQWKGRIDWRPATASDYLVGHWWGHLFLITEVYRTFSHSNTYSLNKFAFGKNWERISTSSKILQKPHPIPLYVAFPHRNKSTPHCCWSVLWCLDFSL